MELRHLYALADAINGASKDSELPKGYADDMEVTVWVSPGTHYGIDREFYRMTHDDDEYGFVHKDAIDAVIDGVRFRILPKPARSGVKNA